MVGSGEGEQAKSGENSACFACPPRIARVLLHVCEMVAYAHGRDVCHCALRPDRVRIGNDGEVWVTGWVDASVGNATDSIKDLVALGMNCSCRAWMGWATSRGIGGWRGSGGSGDPGDPGGVDGVDGWLQSSASPARIKLASDEALRTSTSARPGTPGRSGW